MDKTFKQRIVRDEVLLRYDNDGKLQGAHYGTKTLLVDDAGAVEAVKKNDVKPITPEMRDELAAILGEATAAALTNMAEAQAETLLLREIVAAQENMIAKLASQSDYDNLIVQALLREAEGREEKLKELVSAISADRLKIKELQEKLA